MSVGLAVISDTGCITMDDACSLTAISYFRYFTINGVCSLPVTSDAGYSTIVCAV